MTAWPGAAVAMERKGGLAENLILIIGLIFFTFMFQLRVRQSPELVWERGMGGHHATGGGEGE